LIIIFFFFSLHTFLITIRYNIDKRIQFYKIRNDVMAKNDIIKKIKLKRRKIKKVSR